MAYRKKSRRKGSTKSYSKRSGRKSYGGGRTSRGVSSRGAQTVRIVIQQAPPVGIVGDHSLMQGSPNPANSNGIIRKARF